MRILGLGLALSMSFMLQATPPSAVKPMPAKSTPGQTFHDCSNCPEMVVVPGGHFTMGAPANEVGRDEIEGPLRTVNVGQFAVGKFDVTRGQWAAFASSTHRDTVGGCAWAGPLDEKLDPSLSWRKLSFTQDDSHPVVCITWQDAQDYVHWLSQQTSQKYRLLSEAEWEYAARAGTTTPYPWGQTASHENANYGTEDCCSGLASGRDQWVQTSPVGSFSPNKFGLHDMHGNVLQWVQDCFSPTYAGLPTDGSAYQESVQLKTAPFPSAKETNSCSYRVVRGGDWGDPSTMIRSAFRNIGPGPGATLENYRSGGLGFRVARTLN